MKKWIKNLGIVLIGLGIAGFFMGEFNFSNEGERAGFYIIFLMLFFGLGIEITSFLQERKSKTN